MRFVCVQKCFFMLRRWSPGQVFDFVEGGHDPFTGRALRKPADVGLKNYFQEVPADYVPTPEVKASAFKVRRKRVVGPPIRFQNPAPVATPASTAPLVDAQRSKGGRS